MLRATLRGLFARKLRLLMSGFAVVLGVAFVSGTFVLTDTLGKVFDDLFANVTQNTAVTVRSASTIGGDSNREPVPAALVSKVRALDGVAEVVGHTESDHVAILDKRGKAYKTGGPPVIGVTIDVASQQESLRVKRGTAPSGPDQVAVDAQTARKLALKPGDHLTVLANGPRRIMTFTGVIGFEKADSFAGATLIAADPPTAQTLFGTPGTWTEISVAADQGVSQTALRDRVATVLPKGVEAITQKQTVDESANQLKKGLSVFNTILLVFAGIALFVGMFLIFNTFSMLVAQRARELALMRALGASRGQVTTSVLIEALVVGVVSSALGFGLGIGVAVGLRAFLAAVGIDLPAGDLVIASRTLVVSLVVGVGVTAVAALIPARRAARVAPVQAMRESGPAEDRSLTRRTIVGLVLLVLAGAALARGLSAGTLPALGGGAVLAFLAVATLSPLIARPVVSALGYPFVRLGVPSRLGRGNAVRSPRRTSATAAALMIGLALVAMVSTLGESVKQSLVKVVASSLGADYVLHTDQYMAFSPAAAKGLAGRPELAAVAPFLAGEAKVGKAGRVQVQGVDPAALEAVLKLDVVKGDLTGLADGLAVSETEATNLGVTVGATVPVTWARTGDRPLRLAAVYADNPFAGGYVVSDTTFGANVTSPQLVVIAVKRAPSATPAAGRAAIEQALVDFPIVQIEDRAQFVKAQGDQVDSLLNIITGLLIFSVLIAVLGIVNTLALSVVERTRELGLLRAVGLQRRQLRRMIRVESVLIAVYGALLGIAIGLAFGAAIVVALHDQGISVFAVPVTRLLWVLVAAGLAGVVAAALPARRAARLNVLDAIATT
jgi:putative ABC transport system permease protein